MRWRYSSLRRISSTKPVVLFCFPFLRTVPVLLVQNNPGQSSFLRLSMPPKSSGKMRDPFDNKDCPVFKNMSSMVKWHPRIRKDELPSWLADFAVGHVKGAHPTSQSDAVHHLFFTVFDDLDDCSLMMPAIHKGETIAVFTPNRDIAVSALTFVECSSAVVVFFLATDASYRNIGMASFLLHLLHHKICMRRKTEVEVDLKTNPVGNKDTFEWYQYSCDFVPVWNPKFPIPLEECFSVEVDDSPFRTILGIAPICNGFGKKSRHLTLFSKTLKAISTKGFSTIPIQPIGLWIMTLRCMLIFRETYPCINLSIVLLMIQQRCYRTMSLPQCHHQERMPSTPILSRFYLEIHLSV